MIVGDYVLCYTASQRKNVPPELLENQMASLGTLYEDKKTHWTVAVYGELGYGYEDTPIYADIPKKFVYPCRFKAYYNLWMDGGYQSYLIFYLISGALYLRFS